jgi:glycerate-2-kinase
VRQHDDELMRQIDFRGEPVWADVTTVSGGARVVRLAAPGSKKRGRCRACATAQIQSLKQEDRTRRLKK